MNIVGFFWACVAMVVSMHAYHHLVGHDPLAFAVLNGPYVSVDSWSLVHVVWFAGLGWLYPDKLLRFFMYGLIWEVLETALAHTALRDFWEERGINSFWDLWFNLLGYRLGELLLITYGQYPVGPQRPRSKRKAPAPAAPAAAQ